jgi:hypothetical protein
MTEKTTTTPNGEAASPGIVGRVLLWLLLAVLIFTFPRYPDPELDASWRMALGWFFQQGLQFGREVVFTYGPLGFLMGKTYSGLQFGSLVWWQAVQAAVFASIIMANERGLRGTPRVFYYLFFLLFGVIYEDALHMIIIALLGWELVRRAGGPSRRSTPLIALFLAVLGIIKFTNLMLAAFVVLVAAALELWQRRPRTALVPAGWFFGGYLALWILCRQNPLNLPIYLLRSWDVSQGYQAAMGLPTPPAALWKALVVLAALIAYTALYCRLSPDKPRALAFSGVLTAFIYLNWKHGFVRADGHMIGFFICALVPVAMFPVLMEDAARWRWLQRALLVPAGVLCIAGIYSALPGVVQGAASQLQSNVWDRLYNFAHWKSYRASFDDRLRDQRQQADLPRVREAVGRATVDVLGYEQAIALFNGLNYRPRPVFQSYAAYTPRLARLNADFYTAAAAPEFALLKLQTLDDRLPSLDDSLLLNLFPHRYEYVMSEKGWQLWRRRADAPDPALTVPRRLRSATVPLNTPFELGEPADQHLWMEIDLPLSLLGRLRDFCYKIPLVQLAVEDTAGQRTLYRLPLLEARTGFMLNPLVETLDDYLNFAGGQPRRFVRRISVEVAAADRKYFASGARVGLFALTPSDAGAKYFAHAGLTQCWMFKTAPVSANAFAAPSENMIDGRKVVVMHAPSEMEFIMPPDAREISGAFGYIAGAYQGDGHTDGAEFRVVWVNGSEQAVLFSRYLNPRVQAGDRGLQSFRVDLHGRTGGRLRLEVDPGPNHDHGWDWTAWTDIEIK